MKKHLRKYNELHSSVYKKVGKKLTDMGHINRGEKLSDYAEHKKHSEIHERATETRELYSKYPQFKPTITFYDGWGMEEPEYTTFITFSTHEISNLFHGIGDNKKYLEFGLYMVPSKQMIDYIFELQKEMKIYKFIYTPYIILGLVNMEFHADAAKMTLSRLYYDDERSDISSEFTSRREAVSLKKLIYDILNKETDYPVGPWNENTKSKPQYQEFEEALSEVDVLGEYGLDMEDIAEMVKNHTVNELYKN